MFRTALLITLVIVFYGVSRGEDGAPATPSSLAAPSSNLAALKYRDVAPETPFSRAWKVSLAPLLASQAFDAASSYGMRELNPALSTADGRFGVKSTAIKFGATAALIGVEYLVIRKHPRAASAFAKFNWATGIVTAGFAAHNYAIR